MAAYATPQGHRPTLIACFLHFDLSFMLWVLLGALGIYIAEDLGLSPLQKGLLVAVPILSGSLLRIPLGLLSDRTGGRPAGIALLAFLFLPLLLGWQLGSSLPIVILVGLMLGTAGASFAVALPLASRWYPPERQGLIMGITAAGNSGTVIANLLAPRLANLVGWHNVLGLAMIPLAVVLVAFIIMAKNRQDHSVGRPIGEYLSILKHGDLWWFCLFYSVTFGGYVGLSSFLPVFLRDQYGAMPVTAGYLTAVAAFVGSGVRPIGGYLADRLGGVRVLSFLFLGIGSLYALGALLPSVALMMVLLVIGMACLGMGNGAVFQMVPQRFRGAIGISSGIVGAIGGLGGFLLPVLLGSVKEFTNSFTPGFLTLSAVAIGSLALLWFLPMARVSRLTNSAIRDVTPVS
ncbi:MAG: NarK/NasA family nitrate transporter [Chloroflexi bacterium]|nr:NarK/NasA family nitrate transporter [Chloroflexota bacterium]